jgi:hypothetical protein
MAACMQCGSVIENEALTGMVCQKCSNNISGIDKPAPKIDPLVQSALVACVVAFVLKFEINGRNYVGLTLGAVAIVLAIVGLVRAKDAPADLRNLRLGSAAGALLLGVLHIVRSLG